MPLCLTETQITCAECVITLASQLLNISSRAIDFNNMSCNSETMAEIHVLKTIKAEAGIYITFMSSGPGERGREATGMKGSSRKPLLSDWQLLVLITLDSARDRNPRSLSPTHENTTESLVTSPLLCFTLFCLSQPHSILLHCSEKNDIVSLSTYLNNRPMSICLNIQSNLMTVCTRKSEGDTASVVVINA